MPDLWLLTASFVTAMLTAGLVCLATLPRAGRSVSGHRSAVRPQLAALSGLASGVLSGMAMQGIVPALPLVSGLDRWLAIGLPLLLLADVVCCCWSLQKFISWPRYLAAAAIAIVILFGSVHLQVESDAGLWAGSPAAVVLTVVLSGILMMLLTGLAVRDRDASELNQLAAGVRTGLALCALQTAAVVVMLGGWIGCGAAALPLTGACGGVLLIGLAARQRSLVDVASHWVCWSLGGVILLGHFFGRLTIPQAGMILVAAAIPLVAIRGNQSVRVRVLVVWALVAVVLFLSVLIPAVLEFQRRMSVLLS